MRRTDQHCHEFSAGGERPRAALARGCLTACLALICIADSRADHNLEFPDHPLTADAPRNTPIEGEAPVAEEPNEFFFADDAIQTAVSDQPLDFFMVNGSEEPAADVGEAGTPDQSFPYGSISTSSSEWVRSPVPGDSAPYSSSLVYSGGTPNWSNVPAQCADGSCQGLDGCRCAFQQRWVNWRHGSDYLYGCVPEGFNGFLTINVTSPSVMYATPLTTSGMIEPGGTRRGAADESDPLRPPMMSLTANISATDGNFPEQQLVGQEPRVHSPGTHRGWNGMAYYWDASHLIHQPLYFRDLNLERHGYSYGIAQPAVSAARFAAQFLLLPYSLAVQPHYEAEYTLGEGRPGSPVPFVQQTPRNLLLGSAAEAGVVTGLIFAFP